MNSQAIPTDEDVTSSLESYARRGVRITERRNGEYVIQTLEGGAERRSFSPAFALNYAEQLATQQGL